MTTTANNLAQIRQGEEKRWCHKCSTQILGGGGDENGKIDQITQTYITKFMRHGLHTMMRDPAP